MSASPIVEQLRARRIQLNMSQSAMARAMGTVQSAISEAERGLSSPNLSTLRRWAKCLGFEVVLVPIEPHDGDGHE
jgi:transcriptional regulator with XRE-family HTH domain